jgi:hypothetical protein
MVAPVAVIAIDNPDASIKKASRLPMKTRLPGG